MPDRPLNYTLSTSPVFALCRDGEVTLLVGLEDQPDGLVRAYLGHRARGVYLLLSADEVEPFRQAWGSGQHVWMHPIPPRELLHRDDALEAATRD